MCNDSKCEAFAVSPPCAACSGRGRTTLWKNGLWRTVDCEACDGAGRVCCVGCYQDVDDPHEWYAQHRRL